MHPRQGRHDPFHFSRYPPYEIREAVRLMKVLDVGALIVCNGRTLVGTLSDRDIADDLRSGLLLRERSAHRCPCVNAHSWADRSSRPGF